LNKREPGAASLAIHNRDHQLRNQRPNKSHAENHKCEQRDANPECDTRLCLSPPRNERYNQTKARNRNHHNKQKRYDQRKNEKTIALRPKFLPRLDNRGAIASDAINKDESAPRSQPREYDKQQKNDANQNANACDKNWLRNLPNRFVEFVGSLSFRVRDVEVTAATSTEVCKPGGKTYHQPFFEIEWLKQNSFHQLERFIERLEDFDR
jgi:hypothetical protein